MEYNLTKPYRNGTKPRKVIQGCNSLVKKYKDPAVDKNYDRLWISDDSGSLDFYTLPVRYFLTFFQTVDNKQSISKARYILVFTKIAKLEG